MGLEEITVAVCSFSILNQVQRTVDSYPTTKMKISKSPLLEYPLISLTCRQHLTVVLYSQLTGRSSRRQGVLTNQLHAGSIQSHCLQDQQTLLLQLKQNLSFNSILSSKLVFWNSSTDCCLWVGVTCSSSGHVIGLDLSEESISGGIDNSSRLFDLHHLRSLDLASNRFNGTRVPSAMGKLANLRHLNLTNAGFSGQIPPEISGLTSLISLHLSADALQVQLEIRNLSMLVRNLTRLTELDLSGINLSAEGGGWCAALSSLTRLRVLNLARCQLSGPIDSSLSKLSSLAIITLSQNREVSGTFPDFLGTFLNLTSLDLSVCGLSGNVPEKIFHLPHLQSLDLSSNYGLVGLIPKFLGNESLQTLRLSGTSFGGNLPDSIRNSGSLLSIDLSDCKFHGRIPDTMANLTHLVYLDFSDNNFSGPIPSFSSAKNLTVLRIGNNLLSGSILSTNWSVLSKLEYIYLSNNSLDGAIPESMFGIPSLRSLNLDQNQFTEILNMPSGLAYSALQYLYLRDNKLAGPFLTFIVQLRILTSLDLSHNRLEGPFLTLVFQLKSLSLLQLSFNNLSGPVNLSPFQQLKNLSYLDLSNNNLWIDENGIDLASFPKLSNINLASCNLTRFPDFLKEQSYLSYLHLSNNQIDGEIPNWIWSFEGLRYLNLSHNFLVNLQQPMWGMNSSLAYLDLSYNKLQGELPRLPFGFYVDFSSNNFSSVIPKDIGDYMESIVYFFFSDNNLHGSIPQSICNAKDLQVLNLSNNSLNGTIPQCLFGMKSLKVLNLKGNNHNGNIWGNFSSNCRIRTIDLNGNQLQGKIPSSLANCKLLEVLDLGNNQIRDAFPTHLGNISSLRVLVLRSNYLHGKIDCVIGNFSWSVLQIVDLASNNFSGGLPVQCLRTWKAMVNGEDKFQHVQFEIISSIYYQDAVTVTMKGLKVELVRILIAFTSIDFSCNKLEGTIPEVMGEFKALHILNLSHNTLTGQIPTAFRNLRQLESLDLSSNHLAGKIPQELADLNFLAVLNLSNNQMVGRIPTSNQFQTFSNDSFQRNDGLCGFPLTKSCGDDKKPCDIQLKESCRVGHSDHGKRIHWNLLSVELGVVFGLAIVILPLMFWRGWRIWYYRHVDVLLSRLFPQWNQRSRNRGSRNSRTGIKKELKKRSKTAGEVALSKNIRTERRTSRVIVV